METQLLTLGEAAAILRVKISTIRAWRLQRKHLTFRKLGGKVLVHKNDIERLIERGKAPARGGAR
jgi:excisionase family DNA binding protein